MKYFIGFGSGILMVMAVISLSSCSCGSDDHTGHVGETPGEPVLNCSELEEVNAKMSIHITDGPTVEGLLFALDQCGNSIEVTKEMVAVYESRDGDAWTAVDPDFSVVKPSALDISAALTMDYSGSMKYFYKDLEQAVSTFINLKRKKDAIEIIKFSSSVEVVQPFTIDEIKLLDEVSNTWSGMGHWTFLYDSIGTAIDDTKVRPSPRLVVAFTDGREEHGEYDNPLYTLDEVVLTAKTTGVPIFTVGLGAVDASVMNYIAEETGGWFYNTPNSAQLESIYETISLAIEQAVQLRWTPTFDSGTVYVRVVVKVPYSDGQRLDTVTAQYEISAG